MEKYEVIIFWSDDDQAFVAEVPELSGCMAHGETQEAALENIKAAMNLRYLKPENDVNSNYI